MKEELNQRILKLQSRMQEKGIDGALIVYAIDVFYYAGTRQNSMLLVPAAGSPVLFVRKSLTRALQESPLKDIRPFPSSKEMADFMGDNIRIVGLTFDVVPVQQYQYFTRLFPGKEFVDISQINREIRSVKSPWEIEQMKKAADIQCRLFAQIPEFLKPGMSEIELAAEVEYRSRKLGTEGYIRLRAFNQELFWGVISAGANSTAPGFFDGPVSGQGLSKAFPQGASQSIIKKNVPVIVDYVCIIYGYLIDMTRIFVIGTLEQELERAYATSLEIQDYLFKNLTPGRLGSELFYGASKIAEEAGFGANFMGAPGDQAKFVGHGVGLELDELPVLAQGLDTPMLLNQTIALEPKFVFPGRGAVGIENTVAVSEKGAIRITEMDDAIVYI
ncbi:MAG: Xaa-Pro peptidase family protein [Clostridia bacterium]|nr:Xaa-Pro peptidase family protein [Clostridia bacterium]